MLNCSPSFRASWSLCALLSCAACGSSLQVNLVEAAHRKPSNVAVYFSVDTRQGEPVPGLLASDFEIYEDGQLVSIDESRQTIVNPEVAAAHYTLLLVDMSGSVSESEQVPMIAEAARAFTSKLEGHQKVGVYAFDGSKQIHRVTPFVRSGRAEQGVSRLERFQAKDPSTNLHGALIEAGKELNRALAKDPAPLKFGTLVVFTDGTDRAARVTLADAVEALDASQSDVFAIGVGNEIDEGTLSRVGRSGYVLVQDASAITAAFEVISERVLSFTQRYYLLSYCSPARAGSHQVTISAHASGQQSGQGKLSYDFDAKNFGPRCNPDRPPPFDTSGKRRAPTRVQAAPRNLRLEVEEKHAAAEQIDIPADWQGSASQEDELPPALDPESGMQ